MLWPMRKTKLLVFVVMTTTTACASAPRHTQAARVVLEGDGAAPIEGVPVFVNGQRSGTTKADGVLDVSVSGLAGERFRVEAGCPFGHRLLTPSDYDLAVQPETSARPELVFRCRSTVRRVRVVVNAEHGANLPIRHLGREIGRTDEQGTANVVLEVPLGEPFELALDTSLVKTLHPQNPTASFELAFTDDEDSAQRERTFVFEQKFTIDQKKLQAWRPIVPKRLEKSNSL
jgi:hypothetical protein